MLAAHPPTSKAAGLQRQARGLRRWARRLLPRSGAAAFDAELAAFVYEHGAEALMVTDGEDCIVAVNPAFTELTGHAEADVLGLHCGVLNSAHQDPAFHHDLRRSLEARGQWQGEAWCRRRSGESFPCWMRVHCCQGVPGAQARRVTLFADTTHKMASEALVWRQANFDPLTCLPNRSMLKDRLAQAIRLAGREDSTVALLALRLDELADRCEPAHQDQDQDEADGLLLQAAARTAAVTRDTDTVARLGTDSLAVLLTGHDAVRRATALAQELLDALAQPFELCGTPRALSASIGVAVYPGEAGSAEDMLRHAQHVMGMARRQGGNQYRFFTPELQQAVQQRAQMVQDLHKAVRQQQFVLHFQPIVDMASGRVCKAEALVRWCHPERGLIGPAEFIPLAEETGLIVEIGDWVFREAARWARHWRERYCPDFQVSVNKSPAQFVRGPGAAAGWLEHLRQLGLPGSAIALEITESLMLNATPSTEQCLQRYRQAGLQVAIDDFGTGYSSIAYLKKLSLDYLKIDRSFVAHLAAGSRDLALCEAIVVMAHKLGLQVVAEGVETEAQRALLAAVGCDHGQGYLFSRPVPAEHIGRMLATRHADAVPA